MDGKTEKLKFTLTKGHLPFLLPLKESGREASKEQASHSTDKNKYWKSKSDDKHKSPLKNKLLLC